MGAAYPAPWSPTTAMCYSAVQYSYVTTICLRRDLATATSPAVPLSFMRVTQGKQGRPGEVGAVPHEGRGAGVTEVCAAEGLCQCGRGRIYKYAK